MIDLVRIFVERIVRMGHNPLLAVSTLVALVMLLRLLSGGSSADFRTVAVPADHDWPPPGWTLQNPRFTVALNAARFLNEQTGWMVGTNGTILATTDGGQNWHIQTSGTDRNLEDVWFVDDKRGWVVGEGGTILYTPDGGRSWMPRDKIIGLARATGRFPGDLSAVSVRFLSESIGFISTPVWALPQDGGITRYGGVLLVTVDGGETWTPRKMDGDRASRVATLVNGRTVIMTVIDVQDLAISGGEHRVWNVLSALPDGYSFADAVFVDQQTGWAIGNHGVNVASVFNTRDGGRTWETQWESPRNLKQVVFVSPSRGWVVGEYGTIFRTDDGGETWTPQDSGSLTHLRAVACASERSCWVLGPYGMNLHTADAGEHWIPQMNATTQHLRGVSALDARHAWAVGMKGTIVATADGGGSWLRQSSGVEHDLEAVTFVSTTHGWAVGDKGTILATINGGATWAKQETRIGEALRGISFVSPNQGWAVGANGLVLTTQDGGKNWVLLNRGGGSGRFAEWNFLSTRFLDSQRGWVVGQNGTILRTRDGGRSWDEQYGYDRGNVAFLSDVSFPTRDHGWAVGWQMFGGQSVIMATDDGGKTWDFQSGASVHSGHSGILRGVTFIDKKVGWIVGDQGAILKTVDSGGVWTKRVPQSEYRGHGYSFHYAMELNAVSFADAKTGWVVGNNGTILHTTTGGE